LTFIPDGELALLSGLNAKLIQFYLESILIHSFEKTWAKNVMYFVSAADNFVSEVVDLHRSLREVKVF
jgi:hypothetical protein